MIGPQDRIKPDVSTRGRLIFPERFATRRLGWDETFRRCQAPDRTGIHRHDAARFRVEANIEFAAALFRGAAGRCIEILEARHARGRWVSSAEAGQRTASAVHQLHFYMKCFTRGLEGHDLDGVFRLPIDERNNRSRFRITAAG